MGEWICDRQLWRTKRGKIVDSGDPQLYESGILIANPGDKFSEKPVIERYKGQEPFKGEKKQPTPKPVIETKPVELSEDKEVKPSEEKVEETPQEPESPVVGEA